MVLWENLQDCTNLKKNVELLCKTTDGNFIFQNEEYVVEDFTKQLNICQSILRELQFGVIFQCSTLCKNNLCQQLEANLSNIVVQGNQIYVNFLTVEPNLPENNMSRQQHMEQSSTEQINVNKRIVEAAAQIEETILGIYRLSDKKFQEEVRELLQCTEYEFFTTVHNSIQKAISSKNNWPNTQEEQVIDEVQQGSLYIQDDEKYEEDDVDGFFWD
eukprot:TRINITY_DN8682_c0_g1_i2.p1 TRINITY_DN8682_c0_g1~~TRINITY_DN8682_c0_g1_i2.p1  ORF type:complete len:216 (-),score=16.81 TRINITY_DN8682_c0_g1_i2:319-966(-)